RVKKEKPRRIRPGLRARRYFFALTRRERRRGLAPLLTGAMRKGSAASVADSASTTAGCSNKGSGGQYDALPALLDARPDLLVEVVGDGVAGWLDDGQRTAHPDAAGHQGADTEGDGEVDKRKAQGLAHGGVSGGAFMQGLHRQSLF